MLTPTRKRFVEAAEKTFGPGAVITKSQVKEVAKKAKIPFPSWFAKTEFRVSHGKYQVPNTGTTTPVMTVVEESQPGANNVTLATVTSTAREECLIPQKDKLFVKFGFFTKLRKIIESQLFYPIFVTGLSGNGKTFMVQQACAAAKRELIRVNLTGETDEDDLIGGFRLVNGETAFFKGPVIEAMERGAILLLDEIDLANPARVMCLQSILEGSGYFIKKTGEYVKPAPGFTVIATGNTKGKGSEDGQFIGTNILNEAFLERFPITVEQDYPAKSVEQKILSKVFESLNLKKETEFIGLLVEWADLTRKTFLEGGSDDIISTRRLVHIANAFSIFEDRMESIKLCVNRFDEETKTSFLDFYTKIDEQSRMSDLEESETGGENKEEEEGVTTKDGDADESLAPF